MAEFIALVEVDFYDEIKDSTASEIVVLTEVDTYEEVAHRIEAYYGNTLEGMKINLLDGPFLYVNHRAVMDIMTGDIALERADDCIRGCGIR